MLLLGGLELLDLPDEIGLLVVELLVLGAVGVELGEEVHELVLVAQEYVQYRLRLIRVRHEHLKQLREGSSTGFSSEIGTMLRDWAVGQAWGSCYSRAALSSNDSKTL